MHYYFPELKKFVDPFHLVTAIFILMQIGDRSDFAPPFN